MKGVNICKAFIYLLTIIMFICMFNLVIFFCFYILSYRYYLTPQCCSNNSQGHPESAASIFLVNYCYPYFCKIIEWNILRKFFM